MAYLVCSQCGGKALAVSSRCPRCQTPFPRLEDRTPPAPKSRRVPILIAGAIVVAVAGGYALWLVQNGKRPEPVTAAATSAAVNMSAADSAGNEARPAAETTTVPVSSTAAALTSPNAAVPPAAASTSIATPRPPVVTVQPLTAPASASGDSLRWERAIVRSDVNLRKTASRAGESLRVLRIDQPVELGGYQEGWRQVRIGTMIGWADPRHFEIAPRKR